MGERFTDNQRIEGTIQQMLDAAIQFIHKNMKVKTIINPNTGKKEDHTDYPIIAIRKAIINALVHRDYSFHTQGMPIQILMFDDRLEIHNPGGIYGRIRIDQLGKAQPDTRNPLLAIAMEVIGITENRYSGIPTIRKAMKVHNLNEPEFLDQRGNFIIRLFKETEKTREDITNFLGINSKTYAIQTFVMPLVEKGYLKLTIPDKPKSRNQTYQSTNLL